MTQSYSFRNYLNSILEDRTKNNPYYSLRAFALQTGVSVSHFSRVLRGEKNLSLNLALKIASNLKLSKKECDFFIDLVRLDLERNQERRASLLKKICSNQSYKVQTLELEVFNTISDWYHFAILSLMKTRAFDPSPKWISSRLGITELEARCAWNRLLLVGLIEKVGNKFRAVNDTNISTTDDLVSLAIKQNHEQAMNNAVKAMYAQDVTEREYDNISVSVKKRDLPKIKKLIRQHMDELNREIDSDNGDEVYQINLQFFRLSQ